MADGLRGADLTIRTSDGRQIGACDLGGEGRHAVLWSHGGPGSRLEPVWLQDDAVAAGLRIIGVDRPGYGLSDPQPGRTIADGAADLLVVADHLGVDRFLTVGVSTGGAYALAAATLAPDRVRGVLACCAVTDMAHGPARSTMHGPQTHALWDAPDRDAALAAAETAYGQGFSVLLEGGMGPLLCPTDAEVFADPAWLGPTLEAFGEWSRHGLAGYADDRLADGVGWSSFDVAAVGCPVTVLHGDEDMVCDVVHARHTAEIVPGASLVVVPGAGHFSIERHIVPELVRLADAAPG